MRNNPRILSESARGEARDEKGHHGTYLHPCSRLSDHLSRCGRRDFSVRGYFDELVLEKMGPGHLEISIRGPSHLGYKELGTSTADVFRGSGDYGYQWYKKMDGSDHWYPLGTGQTQGVSMLTMGFTLKVDVCDALTGAEGSATKHVEYEGDEEVRRVI